MYCILLFHFKCMLCHVLQACVPCHDRQRKLSTLRIILLELCVCGYDEILAVVITGETEDLLLW